MLLKQLVDQVNKAKCFTVLVDETSDISGVEQVSLCARYVNTETLKLREDFLCFVTTSDFTGAGIADLILKTLVSIGIDITYLRGQGYDGAASMSGKYNGVQAHILKLHPLAVYTHCAAHCLNLAVSSSCEIIDIRNCMGTIGQVRTFFNYPKRKDTLLKEIEKLEATPNAKTLKRNCATRWIERFQSISDFIELLDAVISALDEIELWSGDASKDACSLRAAILQPSFMVSLLVLRQVFAIGLPLSKHFQKTTTDLKASLEMANAANNVLKALRSNADQEFAILFEEVKSLCQKFDIQLSLPRINQRQKHRANHPVNGPEDYYRVSIYLPFLDLFMFELDRRFLKHKDIFRGFKVLFPQSNMDSLSEEDAEDLILLLKKYEEVLDSSSSDIIGEFKLYTRCQDQNNLPYSSAMDALAACNVNMFPNCFKLFQILATIPVSTATVERSFSTLKRIKTYLRNTASQSRLNGLAMLSIHRELQLTAEDVLNELAKQGRKLDFII